MKKVTILYSTSGMGHKKAALAIRDEFSKNWPNVQIDMVDSLEFSNKAYKFFYRELYVFLMSKAKWLWSLMFKVSNNPTFDRITKPIRARLDYNGIKNAALKIAKENPDAVITTHFLLTSTIEILQKELNFTAKTFAIMTDYGPHSFWLSNNITKLFVGSDLAKKETVKRGINKDNILVTGIPTTDEFLKDFNVPKLKKEHGLNEEKKTIFLMSGGFGVGPMNKMLLSLNTCNSNIQVVVVCGHNKQVYKDIIELKSSLKYPVVVFGFTDKVAELMAISDIMITKAGGISVTEALVSCIPMILFNSVPGQETWNENFLIKEGTAVKAKNIHDLPILVDNSFVSRDVYNKYIENIKRVRKPNAAKDIVSIVMNEIDIPRHCED